MGRNATADDMGDDRRTRPVTDQSVLQRHRARHHCARSFAAFLCAHLGIKGELKHAEYIATWIALLKEDARAIFTAASQASKASDYLRAFSEVVAEAA